MDTHARGLSGNLKTLKSLSHVIVMEQLNGTIVIKKLPMDTMKIKRLDIFAVSIKSKRNGVPLGRKTIKLKFLTIKK